MKVLCIAAYQGCNKIAKLLLQAGALSDTKNCYGETAMESAWRIYKYSDQKERRDIAKVFQLLYNAHKEALYPCYPEDLSPYNINVKRRLSSTTLRSTANLKSKKQKTKLTKKLQSQE